MAAKSETLRLLVLHSSADNTEDIIKALKNHAIVFDKQYHKVVIDLSTGADVNGYYEAKIYQAGTYDNSISDYLKNMENI